MAHEVRVVQVERSVLMSAAMLYNADFDGERQPTDGRSSREAKY